MTDRATDDRRTDRPDADIDRRTFIAAGGAVGATVLAGCASESESADESPNGNGTDDGETDESATFGDGANFRLLVSDRPADIGDFERLDVTFDSARIFDGGGDADEEEGDDGASNESTEGDGSGEETETETDGGNETDGSTEGSDAESTDEDTAGDSEAAAGGESDGTVERRRGFYWLDLEGATVDLTEVVGEKAVSVFEGGLSPGSYEKIELHVAGTEGVVDGETVNVKVPSEKLQITHPFEVSADEPLEFVFDINVVKRGKNNGYNLQPVISESGVAGKDVDVERVDEGESGGNGSGDDAEADSSESPDGTEDGTDGGDGTGSGGNESEANP